MKDDERSQEQHIGVGGEMGREGKDEGSDDTGTSTEEELETAQGPREKKESWTREHLRRRNWEQHRV
jgi:hypothetical protein